MRIWKQNIFRSTTAVLRGQRRAPRTITFGRPARQSFERFFV